MQWRRLQVGERQVEALWAGDGSRLAVCLHGFPDDPGSWAPVLERLAGRGFTAVAPFLRGTGPGDRVEARRAYDLERLGADVLALIEALDRGPAVLVGHDWGALASYAAAARAPARIERLVGLSVPPLGTYLRNLPRSPRQALRSGYLLWFQAPGLAERSLAARDLALVERLWRSWSPGWVPPPERLAEVRRTLTRPGALRAALGPYRALLQAGPRAWRRRLGAPPLAVPAWLLVGARDRCVLPASFAGAERAFRGPCRVEVVPGAGHFLPLEAPARVARAATAPL